MPYSAAGEIFYTTNGESGTLTNGQPVINEKVAGVAIKQGAPSLAEGISTHYTIAKNEDFAILCKGVVQVDEVSGAEHGDPIYITSENKLTKTEGENALFGVCVEIEGERGTPKDKMRVDLDKKDQV